MKNVPYQYPRGHLRGTVEDVMRSLRVTKKSSAELKTKAIKTAVKKVPKIIGGEDRVRSIMNYVLRTGFSGAHAVAATKKSVAKKSAKKAAPRKRAKKSASETQVAA